MTTTEHRAGLGLTRVWTDERARGAALQFVVAAGVAAFVVFIVVNTAANLEQRGLNSGFDFLGQTAFFDVNQSLIEYSSRSTFGRALVVGLLNTLLVSVLGIVAATVLGFFTGILRLSPNWLVSRMVTSYIEITRNVPLLLQIVFWWSLLTTLPRVQDARSLGEAVFLSNRGVRLPAPLLEPGFGAVAATLAVGLAAAVAVTRWARRRRLATGQSFPTLWTVLGLVVVLPAAVYLALGQPLGWEFPTKTRFNFQGGINITPELVALWWALTTYTGAFISETVRGGILAVSKGQHEAAQALGLRPGATMRLIVVPQAMRVIVPPLTSQFLNLTKNSSLAVAIGYPDFVAVGGTILNQSGRAIEVVAIWIGVYLILSLLTSAFMNWYNRRVALVER